MTSRVQWRRFLFFDKDTVNDNIEAALVDTYIHTYQYIRLTLYDISYRDVLLHVQQQRVGYYYLVMEIQIAS